MSNNQLTHLPIEFWKLEKLWGLKLSGNDTLVSPPSSVIKQGINAVRKYLRASEEGTDVWTSKMVIVGEGNVGKTCLLDALQEKPFNPQSDTTHGIDIRTLRLPHPRWEYVSMELSVWDFGGQDIYHATHQFYLTNHSLFLLVWNAYAGYEAGELYKWLETIHALAPDSPIFIVATHSKPRGADLPKGDISNLYSGKVQFFEVDNKNKQGIKTLKQAIRKAASRLKYMGIERPLAWVIAAKTIEGLEKKCLSKEELFKFFAECGVEESTHESLALYLHELGYTLYYPDEEELKDIIIIKPAWVSQHIAKILDSEEVSEKEGFLPKRLMQKLWDDLEPYWHDKFITLMEKFDLSYRTEDDIEISLIVEKLKYEEHPQYEKKWQQLKGQREIAFKYQLDTIPAGIPTWFIARSHRFTMYIHWRHGALLQDKEKKHLGLLIARPEQKEVWLKVRGPMPYYFFALLRDTLELTFNRFEGMRRIVSVPCPGHNEKVCSHLFNLKHLEKYLENQPPRLSIVCPESQNLEEVEIMKMLFGISYTPDKPWLAEQITRNIEDLLDRKSKGIVQDMKVQFQELVKFIQLEFIKSYRMQQEIMDQTCPNLFTLKPKEFRFYNRPLEAGEYELQLYCQMPGRIHPAGEGSYTIKIPRKWLIAIAPFYNKMLKIFKWMLPTFIPGTQVLLGEGIIKEIKYAAGMLRDYAAKLPYLDVDTVDSEILEDEEFLILEDAELLLIRQLLEKADKARPPQWGGLRRKVTPEGHILWLCPEHLKEYK